MCRFTFVQTHRMYTTEVYPKVTYTRWVIAMCQCEFVNPNKRPALVGDMDDGGNLCGCGDRGNRWETSESSSPFYCKPNTTLKN